MKRRSFVQSTALLSLVPASGLLAKETAPTIVKPKALSKNPTVGLVAPASALTRTAFQNTLTNMKLMGFEARYSDNLRIRNGFLSGTDQQRIDDLHRFFRDPEIEGIICARGGYGTTRLLNDLNYELIAQNPKPFIGYSDITALHLAFYHHTGMVSFHGPVGASEVNDFTSNALTDLVQKGKKTTIKSENVVTISSGTASGPLIGGNLSLLVSMVGTPNDPSYDDHILFIEDVGESTYRIDRMLTQLRSAGKLEQVKGIVLGYFTDCDTAPDDPYYEYSIGLGEVFKDRLGDLGIPVAYGFPFGHEPLNATLPIGIPASFDADNGTLKTEEAAVIS